MAVYKKVARKLVPFLTTIMLLANSYLPYFAYGIQPTIAHADAPPALAVTFDKSTNELELAVNTASKVEYAVSYIRASDTGYQVEGVQGSGDDELGIYKKKLFFGTCSGADCVNHSVKRTIVKVRVQDLSWTYENKLVFEVNGDLSLVEEGKIENLDLTEADTKWLEDVNASQPSLTPTPTYAPPTETPTLTPTETMSTPPIEVIETVTVAPTPTTQIPVPELNETVSIVVEETTAPADSSLIDTVLSTIFPFLYTDKPDYTPTEKAVISGKEFMPETEYTITISSSDEPAISFTDSVSTSLQGSFEYVYQLDGTLRLNYMVEVRDSSGTVVAKTTFTDPPAPSLCGDGTKNDQEECDGSDLGGLSSVDFVCKNNCTLDLVTPKVNICHATDSHTNPYNLQEPNKSADVNGHDGHTGGIWYLGIADHSWGDIIPPFAYIGGNYPGKNWTTTGQTIYNNQCNIPSPTATPTSTPTDTPTHTPSPTFTPTPTSAALLVINEIDYDQPGMDTAEFIEIKNIGDSPTNLDSYELRLINGNSPSIPYQIVDLPNVSLNNGDYFVVCSDAATVLNCDLDIITLIQNAGSGLPEPDAVALYNGSGLLGIQIDTVSYEGSLFMYTEGTGVPVPGDNAVGSKGLSRYADGQDTNDNSSDFLLSCITPGEANVNYSDCANPPTETPTSTPSNTPTNTPTPTPELQCKHENAECDINSSGKECCEGLVCTPFNPTSGNGKCLPDSTPTPTETPTPTNTPTPTETLTPTPTSTDTPTPTFTPTPTPAEANLVLGKFLCDVYGQVPANQDASTFDATGGHYSELGAESPVLGAAIDPSNANPGECVSVPWVFDLYRTHTDLIANTNILQTVTTSAGGTTVSLTGDLYQELTNGGSSWQEQGLWVKERDENTNGYRFGALKCYTDHNHGDNAEYVFQASPTENDTYYCYGYNLVESTPTPTETLTPTPTSTDTPTPTFTPTPTPAEASTVVVYKFNDLNSDGVRSEDEELLSDWDIIIGMVEGSKHMQTTDTTGSTTFTLDPGEYILNEYLKSNWVQTGISCENDEQKPSPTPTEIPEDNLTLLERALGISTIFAQSDENGYALSLEPGSRKICYIGNHQVNPLIYIRKFNNKWPIPQSTNAEILYTIIVRVINADLNDVKVIDLPPEGFTYKPGSWKALKNGVPYSIPEPAYHSPGVWSLGNIAKDDVITLTYIATIGGNEKPGVYKDLAWAYGCSDSTACAIGNEDRLLASSEDSTKTDPGIITDNVVGTQIEIPKVGTPDNTINILEKREVGSVLGASTQRRLPATGLSNSITLFALFQLVLGAVFGLLYFLSKRMKKILKIGFSIMIVGSLVLFVQPQVLAIDASEVAVRVEQPRSPVNEGFDLGFVVLDIMGRQLTARCYVSSPKNSWTFTQFGSDMTLKAGGNSGFCKVNTGDLAEGDNVYEVRVTVLGEPATPYVKQVDNVTVKYISNSSRPGVPTNYNRQDVSSCEKKISFLSANDGGKTVRVEVYRGESTEFTLNDGTKVGTFNIGSNTPGAHVETVPDCNKKYYYALRAFDAAGNYSDVVGDRVYETTTTTTSGETTETVEGGSNASGAINVLDSDIPAEGDNGQVLGEGTDKLSGTPEATPEGAVLGEDISPTQATNFANAIKETVTSRGAWIVVGGVLLLFGILYFVYRKWTGKDTK